MSEWNAITITMGITIILLLVANYWPWHDEGGDYARQQCRLDAKGGVPEPLGGWPRISREEFKSSTLQQEPSWRVIEPETVGEIIEGEIVE